MFGEEVGCLNVRTDAFRPRGRTIVCGAVTGRSQRIETVKQVRLARGRSVKRMVVVSISTQQRQQCEWAKAAPAVLLGVLHLSAPHG